MKKLILLPILVLLFSCTTDSTNQNSSNLNFSSYIMTSTTNYNNNPDYNQTQLIFTSNLVNNKFFSTTDEVFTDGVLIQSNTSQNYFYSGDLLNHIILYQPGNPQYYDVEFFYDNQQRMIGAKRLFEGGGVLNYRFIHQGQNIVYCERLTDSYDSISAEIIRRCILEFDVNNNVINAGYDNNLDGIIENENHLTYQNDDLIQVDKYNGSIVNFQYSTIINNYSFLHDNSHGKRNRRLLCSEFYGGLNFSSNIEHSKHFTISESSQGVYEVLPTGFFNLNTTTFDLESPSIGQNITTVEFFFN